MQRDYSAILSIVSIALAALAGRIEGKPTDSTSKNFPGCQATCNLEGGACQGEGLCVCFKGWKGENCDHCLLAVGCDHGTCRLPDECNCEEGYGGRHCQLDLLYCQRHQPCKNGATCSNDGTGSYVCSCSSGYTGNNCELEEQPSLPAEPLKPLCYNGGTCVSSDTASGCRRCVCPSGFVGYKCERRIRWCPTRPCANGGTCIDLPEGYQCQCSKGYKGKDCAEDVNECETLGESACKNEGVCINIRGSFKCSCLDGFEGWRCNKLIVRFTTNPQNSPSRFNPNSANQIFKIPDRSNANLWNSRSPAESDAGGEEDVRQRTLSNSASTTRASPRVGSEPSDVDVVPLKQIIQSKVVIVAPPSDEASFVQGITFAFLGVAIVLFIGIAIIVWFHYKKILRNNYCGKVTKHTNEISHVTVEMENCNNQLLGDEVDNKSSSNRILAKKSNTGSVGSDRPVDPSGYLSSSSAMASSSGGCLYVALQQETGVTNVRNLFNDVSNPRLDASQASQSHHNHAIIRQ